MTHTTLHKAETRGHTNHGWLNSFHTFSFGNYHNPDRMNFGVLRVLNDDTVAGGEGFGKHPHDNMEIISIPLSGNLMHQDNMGTKAIIKAGDIQVMSAGTGVSHSEYNASETEEVKFLQIWLFPNKRNVQPRYQQISLNIEDRHNKLQQILSPNKEDDGVWIYQDAWFSMGNLDEGVETFYELKKNGNGIYVFVLKGDVIVEGQQLNARDGLGIVDLEKIKIVADSEVELLLMEVPM